MDINSPKRNGLDGRKNLKAQAVVDLRGFGETKYPKLKQNGEIHKINSAKESCIPKNKKFLDNVTRAKNFHTLKNEGGKNLLNNRIGILTHQPDNRAPKIASAELAEKKAKKRNIFPVFNLLKAAALKHSFMPQSDYHPHRRKFALSFAVSSFLAPVMIFSCIFAQSQLEQKTKILGDSAAAYNSLKAAAGYSMESDFASTAENFAEAQMNFARARETINGLGMGIGEIVAGLPIGTPISTAQNLTEAGENISLAGKDMGAMLEKISTRVKSGEESSLDLEILIGLEENLRNISSYLSAADANMQKVNPNHVPEDMRKKVKLAQQTLPSIAKNFRKFSEDYPYMLKILGNDRPQKYLLLFENNSEMRATGGFIGSYGILDIENGKVKNLMIDGIFNPDGQLQEKIIPPMPIQKISASWSMHDSNWFADFPTSAKKAALFYEKTGGQTVDGVIAITPEAIKKLLEITGPIEIPAYNTTINADNFISQTQIQVEELYDKKENKPKKILSDMAPILFERLFKDNAGDEKDRIDRLIKIIEKIQESLQEKHIIIYHRDEDIEKVIQKRGWGGEIIKNQKGDYLAVINSNINGYKTDAVIQESIKLETEIKEDGTAINTLTINRKHLGGDDGYYWYNRVNSDYMRVYVPKGSILLETSGNTVEEYRQPMDYTNFKTDPDVAAMEKTIKIDPDSQTQVFEEAGKTVFGNWVYVSPKEEVTVVYKYELPFKVDFSSFAKSVDSYAAIIQKQAGSTGSNFEASIKFPEEWEAAWKTEKVKENNRVSEKLATDLIYGMIFTRK